MGGGCIYPCFLALSTSWRWVVSFKPRPLYRRGKNPRYPLDRSLGGSQNRYGHGENSCPYRDSNSDHSIAQPVARRYTDSQKVVYVCNESGHQSKTRLIVNPTRDNTVGWRWKWRMPLKKELLHHVREIIRSIAVLRRGNIWYHFLVPQYSTQTTSCYFVECV
jgi:hypothetical protein